MTDYKCIQGHDKCNEMNADSSCPYCVPVVVSPRPWIVERDAAGTPIMIRDAEGKMISYDDPYDGVGLEGGDILDVVRAVNYYGELVDVLKDLVYSPEPIDFDKAQTLWDKVSKESEK